MKLEAVSHSAERVASSHSGAIMRPENALLSACVLLAFAFVGACIFLLG
jgi:hypothetical protein